jgi:hypothetical protein
MVFVGVVALALIGAGCGSDSIGSGDSAAPTKAEFIKQGDAICQKANELEIARLKALEGPGGSAEADQEKQLRVVILPAVRKEAEEIGDLVPPEGDGGKVKAIVVAYEAALSEGEEDISTLLDGSSSKFTKAFTLAQRYGFKICGVS